LTTAGTAPPAVDKLSIAMVDKLVKAAAQRYLARATWADFDDLYQAGFVSALEAARTYKAARKTPPVRYVWRAIIFGMKRTLWNASAVVSGGKHNPRTLAAKVSRADDTALEYTPGHLPTPEQAYIHAEAMWLMRARLREIARGSEVLVNVVLETTSARDAAKQLKIPVVTVQRARRAVLDVVRDDKQIRNLSEDANHE
jgi:DNA-directed RNA polymerase specialized sigma24 family protein